MAQILEKKSNPQTDLASDLKKPEVQSVKKSSPQNTKVVATDFKIRARFIKSTPDKIRLVAKTIVGKEIEDAIITITFIPKYASKEILSVLKNAQSQLKDRDWQKAWVKAVRSDEGPKLKRRRIIHRGRATTILKRMSHLTIEFVNTNPNPSIKLRVKEK